MGGSTPMQDERKPWGKKRWRSRADGTTLPLLFVRMKRVKCRRAHVAVAQGWCGNRWSVEPPPEREKREEPPHGKGVLLPCRSPTVAVAVAVTVGSAKGTRGRSFHATDRLSNAFPSVKRYDLEGGGGQARRRRRRRENGGAPTHARLRWRNDEKALVDRPGGDVPFSFRPPSRMGCRTPPRRPSRRAWRWGWWEEW